MIVLLSPAKDLDLSPLSTLKSFTQPRFLEQSEQLIAKLRTLNTKQVAKLMDLSPKLAELNWRRYQDWSVPFSPNNAKPAAFSFNGEVYRGLDAASLKSGDLRFAQQHVRILSGLHGLLRPLDLIQAYRLEMGCGLSMGRGIQNIYSFWGDRITNAINEDLVASDSNVVVDLASGEYFKSVQPTKLAARVITPVFKEKTPGGYKVVMIFAKRQRGRMCRWIVDHRLQEPDELKHYNVDSYKYNATLSEGDQWVYTRNVR